MTYLEWKFVLLPTLAHVGEDPGLQVEVNVAGIPFRDEHADASLLPFLEDAKELLGPALKVLVHTRGAYIVRECVLEGVNHHFIIDLN